ncbi:MAG: SPFH/Band 7/PHB domain protein [Epsilonproteobacteria bacterium]|nr:SPFH/Band 7/PHB domain protein [Campylobacterota bacterium]
MIWLILGIIVVLLIIFFVSTINIIPQGEVWVVERLGKFNRISKPGIRIILFPPFYERVRKEISTKDQIVEIPNIDAITEDNVIVTMNAVAFIKVTNPFDAVYGIVDYQKAIVNLVKTSLRAIVGNMKLDEALSSREKIKTTLKTKIIDDVVSWGVTIRTVEIVDLLPSASMQKAMEKQATAERERRALEIKASGEKMAKILEAEARLEVAKKEAEAQQILAQSSAFALEKIKEISGTEDKDMPANFLLGEKYLEALKNLSTSDNSKLVVYPADLQNALKGLFNINKKDS